MGESRKTLGHDDEGEDARERRRGEQLESLPSVLKAYEVLSKIHKAA